MADKAVTKILFIDEDETSFQFRKCMVQVLQSLPPVELFHAQDATEALQMLDNVRPDVVILDDEMKEECELFLESLTLNHPPIMLQIDGSKPKTHNSTRHVKITSIRKNESLAGIHETLVAATDIAAKEDKLVPQ